MPRRVVSSDHYIARIRAWFGLSHEQVAQLLEVSSDAVRAWESRRRAMPGSYYSLLQPLLLQVPAEVRQSADMRIQPTTAEAQHYPAGTAKELDFRRQVCDYKAEGLRFEADKLAQRLSVAQRWALALPTLQTAYADPAFHGGALSTEQLHWVQLWLRRQTRPLPPAVATRWHLLKARIAGYKAESAALAAALGMPPSEQPVPGTVR